MLKHTQVRALVLIGLALIGVFGSYSSVQLRRGVSGSEGVFAAAMACTLVWCWLIRDQSLSTTQAAILFNLVYEGAYIATFYATGSAAGWRDLIGLMFMLAGMIVSSL